MPLDLAELIDPLHTAVLTMELQRGVVGDHAVIRDLAEEAAARGVVANAAKVVRAARDAGARVVHCTAEFRADRAGSNDNSPMLRALAKQKPHLLVGTEEAEVMPELGPEPSDVISPRRHGLTPFPGTTLDQTLRNLGVSTIVATGVSVNIGVTGMVMVAVDLGYRVALVTDAVAGVPRDYADAVIEHTLAPLAARVTTDQVLATWGGNVSSAANLDFDGLLRDKVAVITGSASGQGRAAALLMGRHGARVVVADVNDEGSAETVKMLEEHDAEGVVVHADVSTRADCDTMIEAAMERYGRINVLYNNAAVQMSGRLVDCTDEDWDLTIATNLNVIFYACRAAFPHMLAGDGGSIINTASTLGLIGSEGYAAYGAAKAGLVLLTKQIAVEYGPTVRANVIAPGSIDTPRFRKVLDKTPGAEQFVEGLKRTIPVQRLGTAEDVAAIALFLATDMSSYISGAVLPADGGLAVYR